jgi:hypothetical protein
MFLLGDWKHGECRLARRGFGSIRVPRVGRCVLATNFYGKFATREGFRSRQHPRRARSPAMSGPNEDGWRTFACYRSRTRSSRGLVRVRGTTVAGSPRDRVTRDDFRCVRRRWIKRCTDASHSKALRAKSHGGAFCVSRQLSECVASSRRFSGLF